MAKVIKRTMEVFPPSDRELALRAQIKTGWSTLSSHHRHSHAAKLTEVELRQIQQVLQRAQAMEHMEEVRVGLQILQHKKMVEKCRGDGVRTCRICNRDISSKRSSRPEPIQFCNDCQMVVCSRCKVSEKQSGGLVLCTVCYEERELWKKSGSWLNNSKPNVNIPDEDLEEIQQQMSKGGRPGRHREGSPHGFVSPYQLEVEDQDDDDEDMSHFTASPSGSQRDKSSPTDLLRGLKAASKELDFDVSPGLSNFSDSDDSHSRDGGVRPRSRSSGLSRRSAISKADKGRLMRSRENARSRYRSGSQVPGPSLAAAVNSTADDPLSNSLPSIKVRKPSTTQAAANSTQSMPRESGLTFGRIQSVPQEPEVLVEGLEFARTKSVPTDPVQLGSAEDSGSESNRSYIIRQMHDIPSSDSDIMMVEGLVPESVSGIDVLESIQPEPFRRQSPSGSLDRASREIKSSQSPTAEFKKVGTHAAQDEFKKVGTPSAQDEFKKVGTPAAQDEFKKVGTPAAQDEFKKIGTPAAQDDFKKTGTPQARDEFKKIVSPAVEDEFTKIGSSARDEFKKVGGSPARDEVKKVRSSPVRDDFKKVGGSPARNEFEKVGGSAQVSKASLKESEVSGTALAQSMEESLFKKVGGATTSAKAISEADSSKRSESVARYNFGAQSQSPPRNVEFRREVSGEKSETAAPAKKRSPPRHLSKANTPPRNADVSRYDASEFKKVPAKETKLGAATAMDITSSPKHGDRASTPPKKIPAKEAQVEAVMTTPLGSSPNRHDIKASTPPRSANVGRSEADDEFKKIPSKPIVSPRSKDVSKNDTDEFQKVEVPSSSASLPSQPVKPVPKRRVLPSSRSPPLENQPLPMQRSSSSELKPKVIGDVGKQGSTTSVSSINSEGSVGVDAGYSYTRPMDSPVSSTSSGSADAHQEPLEPLEPRSTRGFTRRNAQRSPHKRPTLNPRPASDDVTSGNASEEVDGAPMEDEPPRMRSRSHAIKRPGRRPVAQRGELSSGASGDRTAQNLEDSWELGEELRRTSHARGSSLDKRDRALARRARDVTQQKREQGASATPTYKLDGHFGSIQLTLMYDERKAELTVTVHSCKGLRAMDKSGLSDPYVKLFLQPRTKFQKFRTRTILKNLNPTFNESFTFTGLPEDLLEKRKLCAVVMDQDELSKDDLIGGTQINLYEILHTASREICIKRLLDDRSVPKQELVVTERGMIRLKLRYSVETEELVVSILGTRDLENRGVLNGVYIKCLWGCKNNCVKVKTKTSQNLQFTEDLYISTGLRDLVYSTLTVGVWEHRSFKDKQLGEVQFNSASFWKGFSTDPKKVVMDWYLIEAPVSLTNRYSSLPR